MNFLRNSKRALYFYIAAYFVFFAKIMLKRWRPTVVAITGSSGKTTILHLFEAALGDRALYSHRANSTFGIPFHILGLERKSYSFFEWPLFALLAPFKAFRPVPKQTLYIAEGDAERPGEGQFVSKTLMPDITIWLSLGESHGAQFDRLNTAGEPVEKVIAHEFGYFAERTKSLLIINSENPYITRESGRSRAQVVGLSSAQVHSAQVGERQVSFSTSRGDFTVPQLVPVEVGMSVLAVAETLATLNINFDPQFAGFTLPAGRSSVFAGIRDTVLIDSTYNATIDGVKAMLDLFQKYPAKGPKWIVFGDMVEQGKNEAIEHERVAELMAAQAPARVVLVGPRLRAHTLPVLERLGYTQAVSFLMPHEALTFLQNEIRGGETILFKGARFLEGVVERMLLNPADATKLCRREKFWIARRKKFGV